MPTGNEGNRLVVIHRHAAERLPDIACRSGWIRLSIGPFGVHINQAHLNRAVRIIELTIAGVALVVQPFVLRPPVSQVWLPDVLAPAAETKGLESHRLQGDVTGENHEVSPGDFPSILLLDR